MRAPAKGHLMRNGSSSHSFMDWIIMCGAAVLILPPLLAHLLPQVQQALVTAQVLVDHDVVVPIGVGAGLYLGRTVLVAGAVLLFVLLTVTVLRRRAARTDDRTRS
ncbi:hypothetical protein B5P20_16205 [Clavibacter sepedonicus]|nr:hypothetical protein B5P20_16205 [Clavibacter sepedonicus]